MENGRRTKLITAILTAGIVVLVGGVVAAVMLPGHRDRPMQAAALQAKDTAPGSTTPLASATPSAEGSASAPASATATAIPVAAKPVVKATKTPVAPKSVVTAKKAVPAPAVWPKTRPAITYVVKRGDTLSAIAEWFKLHGYGDLYAANAAVIGANPDLIIPGEHITISGGLMSLQGPS